MISVLMKSRGPHYVPDISEYYQVSMEANIHQMLKGTQLWQKYKIFVEVLLIITKSC